MKAPEKKIIGVILNELSPYQFEGTLAQLMIQVQEWITEHGDDATVNWNPDRWFPYDESPSPCYNLGKTRLETDEEFTERIAAEDLQRAMQEERDRKEFERLRVKFESK